MYSGAPSGGDVENSIALRTQSALTEPMDARGSQNALEHVDRGELRHSLKPVAISSEATSPDAMGSFTDDLASTKDLVEWFFRLLRKRAIPSKAHDCIVLGSAVIRN
jgi:hypothetical protein